MELQVKVYFMQANSPDGEKWEIRRLSVTRDSVTFTELKERITTLFPETDFYFNQICWKDEENDYISISSDEELRDAIANGTEDSILKLYVPEESGPKHEKSEHEDHATAERSRPRHREARRNTRERSPKRQKRPGYPQHIWAPYMRRGMYRRIARAWMSEANKDGKEEMNCMDLPQQFPELKRTRTSERMNETPKSCEDVGGEIQSDDGPSKSGGEIPMFWRRQMRRCARRAWDKANGGKTEAEAAEISEGDRGERLPFPVRRAMRRAMVNSWQAAKEDMEKGSDELREDNHQDIRRRRHGTSLSPENARENDKETRQHFLTPYMRRGMRRCMVRTWCLANQPGNHQEKKHARDLPEEWREWMKKEIRQNMLMLRERNEHEDKLGDDNLCTDKKTVNNRPAFRRMRHGTKQTWRGGVTSESAQSNDNDGVQVPPRRFMRREKMMKKWRAASNDDMSKNTEGKSCMHSKGEDEMAKSMHRMSISDASSRRPHWAQYTHRCECKGLSGSKRRGYQKEGIAEKGSKRREFPVGRKEWMRKKIQQTVTESQNEVAESGTSQDEGAQGNAGDDHVTKMPLAECKHRNMVRFWQNAQEDAGHDDVKLSEIPLQWRRASRVAMRRAFFALEFMRQQNGGNVDTDGREKHNLNRSEQEARSEIRMFTREAVKEAWKKFCEEGKEPGEPSLATAPEQWRVAMRRSMMKMLRMKNSAEGEENGPKEDIQAAWRDFMHRNIGLSWRRSSLIPRYGKPMSGRRHIERRNDRMQVCMRLKGAIPRWRLQKFENRRFRVGPNDFSVPVKL